MGQEVSKVDYSQEEKELFLKQVGIETAELLNEFKNNTINSTNLMCGYEVEGWLVNKDGSPCGESDKLISRINDEEIVPEISKFNFEINGAPQFMREDALSKIQKDLDSKWGKCQSVANMSGWDIAAIGSLATVEKEMLTIDNMSPQKRYFALNDEVMKSRGGKPISLNIEGRDKLNITLPDVMTESAATSLQIHIGMTPENAKNIYNASIVASSIIAATCANSPYLFGNDLWSETRVKTFEQSVDVYGFTTALGKEVKRVSMGSGYVNNCISEIFVENFQKFPVLLPQFFEDKNNYKHLHFHNGTIWRWNRPIASKDKNGKTHVRLEQRVPSSGPTTIDMVANMAFTIGLIHHLADYDNITKLVPFEVAEHNFYNASKFGLSSAVSWFGGRTQYVQDLVYFELLKPVSEKLIELGFDKAEVDYYIGEVFKERIRRNLTGAIWQKSFIEVRGKDFHGMIQKYVENQNKGIPLWRWKI